MNLARLHITEPMTMATDYLLTVVSVGWAISLLRKASGSRRRAVVLWIIGFSFAAVASFLGGTAHGFRLHLGEAGHAVLWRLTVLSIAATAALLISAGVRSALSPTTQHQDRAQTGRRWLKAAVAVTLISLLIQRGGWSLHEHLNHNDIYHLIQMVAFAFLYRGALTLHDLVP